MKRKKRTEMWKKADYLSKINTIENQENENEKGRLNEMKKKHRSYNNTHKHH